MIKLNSILSAFTLCLTVLLTVSQLEVLEASESVEVLVETDAIAQDGRYGSLRLSPTDMEFGPNGNLYVLNRTERENAVYEFNAITGEIVGVFFKNREHLLSPGRMMLASNGDFYITCLSRKTIIRIDGESGRIKSSSFVDSAQVPGMKDPYDVIDDGNGNLLVSSYTTQDILKFNANSGLFLGKFSELPDSKVQTTEFFIAPVMLASSPQGEIFASDPRTGTVHRFGESGNHLGAVFQVSSPSNTNASFGYSPLSLALGQSGELFVSDIYGRGLALVELNGLSHAMSMDHSFSGVPNVLLADHDSGLLMSLVGSGNRIESSTLPIVRLIGASQTNDVCSPCEALAGHPSDPTNPTSRPGVADEYLYEQDAFDEAYSQCLQALESCPDSARVLFAMGRLYYIAEHYDEAMQYLSKASLQGHAAAKAYLAELTEDPDTAIALYQEAIAGGFSLAQLWFEARLERDSNSATTALDFSIFNFPPLIQAFYNQDIEYLDSLGLIPYMYLGRFYEKISNDYIGCPTLLDPRVRKGLTVQGMHMIFQFIAEGAFEKMLFKMAETYNRGGHMGAMDWMVNASMDLEVFKSQATQDALILIEQFGCEADVSKRIKEGIEKFLIR